MQIFEQINSNLVLIKTNSSVLHMIDILIIIAYILVALKVLLSVFGWFQNRFHINGNPALESLDLAKDKSSTQNENSLNKQPVNSTGPAKQSVAQKIKTETSQKKPQVTDKKSQSTPSKSVENVQQVNIGKEKSVTLLQKVSEVNSSVQKILKNQNQQNHSKQKVPDSIDRTVKIEIKTQSNHVKDEILKDAYQTLKKQIQDLKVQNTNLAQKLQTSLEESQNLEQSKWKLTQQMIELKKNQDHLLLNMRQQHLRELQQQQKFTQTRDQIDVIISQASQQVNNLSQISKDLMSKIQQLRHELQFCQSQLQNAYESQNKLKQQVQQLNSNSSSRLKFRGNISITEVINHPEYLRIKQKLQKYENGTSSRPRSIIRGQFTPQGDRLSKATDSRISQRRSFISSKITDGAGEKGENSEEVFGQCSFLVEQQKNFLLDEIKRIKKLAIKKTKLIFRLDKLSPMNPHQFIDNIPNVIILIELTNKKVLAGFTQSAFSKQDALHSQKTSVARSRIGSNKALILDLTNKMSFSNNSPNETIIYDENAIVWGKDELVIKNDEPTLLYSSFGTGEGVYWDGKYTLQELLGGGQGFQRINRYEFHRIYIS